MKTSLIGFKLLTISSLNFLAGVGMFAVANAASLPRVDIKTESDFERLVTCQIATAMFWVLITLTALLVIIAAYRYLTSAGDPTKVSNATKTITYAAVAVVVALLAKNFAPIISGLVASSSIAGGSLPPPC